MAVTILAVLFAGITINQKNHDKVLDLVSRDVDVTLEPGRREGSSRAPRMNLITQ